MIPEPVEPLRALDEHLTAMAAAAQSIEDTLGTWAQESCRTTVEAALSSDVHRTQLLRTTGRYSQLMDEAAQLSAELPARIAAGLRTSAWRHLFVDTQRGTIGAGRDLDYAIWQESGHKIPLAYEPVVAKELARVTQLLRRYGYRPDFRPVGARRRQTAPPAAIPAMEAYHRLAMRLPDVMEAAEKAKHAF